MNASTDSQGYLIVKVSTARGAIPLEGATVNIRSGDREDSGILLSRRTNRDGQTEKITLPTPPRYTSQSPSATVPYSTYHIDVFQDGYIPLSFHNVPIFPSIVSIQPAVMIPATEYPDLDPYPAPPISSVISPEDPRTGL